jgi:hypothetical protein
MTITPNRQIVHRDSLELKTLFEGPKFQEICASGKIRLTETRHFPTGKPGHDETLEEWGEVYSDSTGIRAVVFYYRQSSGQTIRSIKRVVTDTEDNRLPMPNASASCTSLASSKVKKMSGN